MGFRNAFNGIPPSSITNDLLADGSVTGTKLSADAIDGKVITGATLRTAPAGQRVQIDHVPVGHVLLYTDAETQAPAGAWVPGVVETDYAKYPGYEHVQSIVLRSPSHAASGRTAEFLLTNAAVTTNADGSGYSSLSTEARLNADTVSIEGNGQITEQAPSWFVLVDINADPSFHAEYSHSYMRAAASSGVFVLVDVNGIQLSGPVTHNYGSINGFVSHAIAATASTGTAVQINPTNHIVFRATSGLKHKVDVERLADFLAGQEPAEGPAGPVAARFAAESAILSDAEATAPATHAGRGRVIDLEPIIYRDRHEVEMHDAGDPAWTAEPGRYIGWAADDFAAAGWEELITRDAETGEPDYLQYERVLAVVVLELKAELAELRARLDALGG